MELDSSELKYTQSSKWSKSTCSTETPKHQSKLSDLKYDCLRCILTYLDFTDLLNIADANAYLKEVSCNVFHEKYQTETFSINSDRISLHGESTPFISTIDSPLESIGKFFKMFGPILTKLAFFGSNNEFYSHWIESCIAKYCTGSLVEILLYNHINELMSDLRQPFSLVESVTIIQSRLSSNISQFNTWFPKMRNLKLIDSTVPNPVCIEASFPYLETLVIWLHGNRQGGFTKSNISETIRLNPNIQDLWFQFYSFPGNPDHLQIDQDLCRLVAVNLRNLERFVWAPDNNTALLNCDRITFKNLKHFVSEAPVIYFSFRQLEELELRRIRTPINEIIEFICRNKKLIKLKITLDLMNLRQATSDQVNKISKNLPKLNELILDYRIFQIDDALKFLGQCKSLIKMQIVNVTERMTQIAHQIAQRHIDSHWKITKTDSDFIFKRKT